MSKFTFEPEDVLNTTCYSTEDILEIIRSNLGNRSGRWVSVKIRYMIKPKRSYSPNRFDRWAKISSPKTSEHLEIGLLKPDKLEIGVLDKIVSELDDIVDAPTKLASDLAYSVKDITSYETPPETYSTKLRVRVLEEDDNARALSTYRNAVERYDNLKARLVNDRNRVKTMRETIATLEESFDRRDAGLLSLEKDIAEQKARLESMGAM